MPRVRHVVAFFLGIGCGCLGYFTRWTVFEVPVLLVMGGLSVLVLILLGILAVMEIEERCAKRQFSFSHAAATIAQPATIVSAPLRPGPPKNPPRSNGVQVIDGTLSPIDGYYYLDQDISAGALLHLLRKHKFNVLSTYEADRADSDDEPQLRFSARNGRRIITCDSDYLSLDAQGVPHAGIIRVPNNGSEWYPEILRVCLQLAEESAKA